MSALWSQSILLIARSISKLLLSPPTTVLTLRLEAAHYLNIDFYSCLLQYSSIVKTLLFVKLLDAADRQYPNPVRTVPRLKVLAGQVQDF
jgi:hypothetical protein